MTNQLELETPPPFRRRLTLDRNDIFFLSCALLCSLTYSAALYLRGFDVTPKGPSFAMAETAKTIWESHSLTSGQMRAVFEAAESLSRTTHSDVWQDVFAMDARGNLVPKHSIISSAIAAPFFGIFGTSGFWLCQQVFFLVFAFALYRCVSALSNTPLPWTSLVAICFFSPALVSSYTFGHDLHGLTFLVAGLYLARSRPIVGGVVLACAIMVRPSHSIVVAPLIFAWFDSRNVAGSIKVACGVGLTLSLLLMYNYYLWGDPLSSAYLRLPAWRDGVLFLNTHPVGFDPKEFMRALPEKLLGGDGLFSHHGTLLTLPCAIWMAFRSSHPCFFRVCLVAAVLNILYVFSYPFWHAGVSPNRFLHPSILLFVIPFTVLIGWLEGRLRNG